MKICVPYFGGDKYRRFVDAWFESYAKTGLTHEVVMITSRGHDRSHRWTVHEIDLSPYESRFREGQPFDVKGALVARAQVEIPDDLLVLDADAEVRIDPVPALSRITSPIAIPVDHGSLIYRRHPFLSPPFGYVRKLCAGVMYFGKRDAHALCDSYWDAFEALRAHDYPWSPRLPALLEQNAWSKVHADLSAQTLPHVFNWSERFLGPNPNTIINHDYGPFKMSG